MDDTGRYLLEDVQLIRREVSTTIRASQLGDAFKPRQVTVGTVVSVMQSPKLLARVGTLAHPANNRQTAKIKNIFIIYFFTERTLTFASRKISRAILSG